MFDAEIAAVLLNRYALAGEAAADLLREGNLEFLVERGELEEHGALDPESLSLGVALFSVESLCFTDGSRALRVAHGPASWTPWTAVAPAVPMAPGSGLSAQADLALAD
jgi:hypothetical protein